MYSVRSIAQLTQTFLYRAGSTAAPVVTVADTQRPVFFPGSCPRDQVLNVTQPDQRQVQVNWTAPDATDNRGTPNITSDVQPGSFFNITAAGAAPHVVTYVATDRSGLTARCQFTVTVFDRVPPSITCPPDVFANMSVGFNHTDIDPRQLAAALSDNDVSPVLQPLESLRFHRGQHNVTRVVVDRAGNTAQCSFRVSVADTQPPAFSGCSAQQADTELATGSTFFMTWTPPQVSDNDQLRDTAFFDVTDGLPGVPVTTNLSVALIASTRIVRTVRVIATDVSGNTANCNMEMTIFKTSFDESDAGSSTDITPIAAGAGGGGSLLLLLLILALVRLQRNKRRKPHDFTDLLNMLDTLPHGTEKLKPREIKREHVKIVSNLGKGNFGTVDKALLEEQRAAGIPAYLVAVKQLLSKLGEDRVTLLQEAAVMAQVRRGWKEGMRE
jgi:hypothetical protein